MSHSRPSVQAVIHGVTGLPLAAIRARADEVHAHTQTHTPSHTETAQTKTCCTSAETHASGSPSPFHIFSSPHVDLTQFDMIALSKTSCGRLFVIVNSLYLAFFSWTVIKHFAPLTSTGNLEVFHRPDRS